MVRRDIFHIFFFLFLFFSIELIVVDRHPLGPIYSNKWSCFVRSLKKDEQGFECRSCVKGENRRLEIIRSVSGKGAVSGDGIGGLVDGEGGRGASERFHCRGTSNRGIMGIVWYWISIQTATSSDPIRATSSALGTARTLPLAPPHPSRCIFTLSPPAYWILPHESGILHSRK